MAITQRSSANQPPPLAGYNLFAQDAALVEGLRREGGGPWEDQVVAFGEALGGAPLEWGRLANEHPPKLRSHDRYGERIDEVEFHPAWDSLLRLGLEAQVQSLPWVDPRPGSHVARATLFMLLGQVEAGVGCPLSMTFASVPALRHAPALAEEWIPRLTTSALCGMAMTERQGGSDVRTNETTARESNDGWMLDGQKWFCSAPMSDAFLVLAQAPAGLSCFLVERPQPGFRIERLKDKLGNRSNASAEIALVAAAGSLVGEEGRGLRTILEMVNHTRLDCVLGSTALMRRAVAEATHHAAHRSAFGRLLIEQPLMRNVLADLCVEYEAATVTALRLARAYDGHGDGPFRRLATAVAKFWICKRTPGLVAEALECLGGNGYVEESQLPRLFRESPLNSIWEGSGNVNALDVLRALAREPETAEAFLAEARLAAGADPRLDGAIAGLECDLARPDEGDARRLLEQLALVLQGSLLVRHGAPEVADAFCASRLAARSGIYGTLPTSPALAAIVERHRPQL